MPPSLPDLEIGPSPDVVSTRQKTFVGPPPPPFFRAARVARAVGVSSQSESFQAISSLEKLCNWLVMGLVGPFLRPLSSASAFLSGAIWARATRSYTQTLPTAFFSKRSSRTVLVTAARRVTTLSTMAVRSLTLRQAPRGGLH